MFSKNMAFLLLLSLFSFSIKASSGEETEGEVDYVEYSKELDEEISNFKGEPKKKEPELEEKKIVITDKDLGISITITKEDIVLVKNVPVVNIYNRVVRPVIGIAFIVGVIWLVSAGREPGVRRFLFRRSFNKFSITVIQRALYFLVSIPLIKPLLEDICTSTKFFLREKMYGEDGFAISRYRAVEPYHNLTRRKSVNTLTKTFSTLDLYRKVEEDERRRLYRVPSQVY